MEKLIAYARSKNEIEWVRAVIDCGSVRGAAESLGIARSTLQDRINRLKADALKRGWGEQHNIIEELRYTESSAKILLIDIETSPTKAYVWKMWKENIGMNQVIDGSYIMCFSAKWLNESDIVYAETRSEDDKGITQQMINLLDEADFVIAHNAERFDIPRINASAIKHGINPPSPYKVIDTLRVARKHFKFERNTLAYLAEYLQCAPKLTHQKFSGFELWKECLADNEEAWQEMMEYNIQDVHTLEEVYLKLRPWIKEHPNVAIKTESEYPTCSKCGSSNLIINGYTHTDVSKFRLYRCQDCGGFSRERSSVYPKMIRNDLLTTVR